MTRLFEDKWRETTWQAMDETGVALVEQLMQDRKDAVVRAKQDKQRAQETEAIVKENEAQVGG